MRSAILWLHVLCGVGWVGAAASFALSATALGEAATELGGFVHRVAGPLSDFCLFCAALIPITGLLNLFYLAASPGFRISQEFGGILCAKIALYALMAWLEWRAISLSRSLAALPDFDDPAVATTRRLVRWYLTIIVAGGMALGLGVWLTGVR